MAEIQPFKAWRYHRRYIDQLDELTSPLFDVVSQKQREALYDNELNSIHLSVPQGTQAPLAAKNTLAKWMNEAIIEKDKLAGIYPYYQYFKLSGHQEPYCRKGFICLIRVYDWSEKVILRHENTIPSSVNDRLELLQSTGLNTSPTHGLYSDDAFELEKYMDESMQAPLYETEDYQGVSDKLSVIHDENVIKLFQKCIQDQKIILADGHHRYEGSLSYLKLMQGTHPNLHKQADCHYHMMYLTNMQANDLRILPTHRLIKNLPDFNPDQIMSRLSEHFHIKDVPNVYDVNEIILGKKWAFGLIMNNKAWKIRLKEEVFYKMSWQFPDQIKALDLTVMHYFVIEKALGIPGKDQRKTPHIHFERNFSMCIREVEQGNAQMALITQEIDIEQVKKVCFSGYTLPQKSTYFYPKAICGFLFSIFEEHENEISNYSRV